MQSPGQLSSSPPVDVSLRQRILQSGTPAIIPLLPRAEGSIGRAFLWGCILSIVLVSQSAAQSYSQAEIRAFIDEMVQKHHFPPAELRRLFTEVQPRPAVIRAMMAPRTARPWHEFRLTYINAQRIDGGVRFWQQHASVIARAAREYGVSEEIIVATIGVETLYGRVTGTFRVLDVLTMLAFQYPPRADFFRRELEEYLLLTREAGFDPLALRGSPAGAIGLPQFLPSSYRSFAVDFDGDGKRDLIGTPADAIGSVANYYKTFGWRTGEEAVIEAEANAGAVEAARRGGVWWGRVRVSGVSGRQR